MPSPLLTFTSPQIRLHFQYGPDGRLSSPQVPAGNMRDLAESRYLPPSWSSKPLAGSTSWGGSSAAGTGRRLTAEEPSSWPEPTP